MHLSNALLIHQQMPASGHTIEPERLKMELALMHIS
jgi:hypothetical protein